MCLKKQISVLIEILVLIDHIFNVLDRGQVEDFLQREEVISLKVLAPQKSLAKKSYLRIFDHKLIVKRPILA